MAFNFQFFKKKQVLAVKGTCKEVLVIPFDAIPRNELLWKGDINLKYGGKYVADKGTQLGVHHFIRVIEN